MIISRKNRAENDRHRGLESFERRLARLFVIGYGIADVAVTHTFDAGGYKPDLTGAESFDVGHLGRKDTDFFHQIDSVVGHHADLGFAAQNAVVNAHQNYHAEITVIPAVNQQRFERRRFIAFGRRQAGDNGFQ